MPYCRNCGTKLEEEVNFCPECGAAQKPATTEKEAAPEIPVVPIAETPEEPTSSGKLSIGLIVWSVINIVFCCLPFAIPSLIMTVMAKDAFTAEEEAKKLRSAKICNLIGTICFVILYILYFVFSMLETVAME